MPCWPPATVPGTTLLALGMGVVAFTFDMIAGRGTMNVGSLYARWR
jgi:hypothetical protein